MKLVLALMIWMAQEKSYTEVSIKVAVRPDASPEELAELKGRFERAAKYWWTCTEGQMAFTKIVLVDRESDGDVIVTNLDSTLCREGVYGETRGTKVYLGGRFPLVTFCHEMGHRWFGLPDEYREPKCGHCVMEPWKGVFAFCGDGNHTGRGEDCWSRIRKKYPKWKHPNPGYGECPPVRVTVENR